MSKLDYSKGWHEGMSLEDTKNLAYYERNMLALYLARTTNDLCYRVGCDDVCGWYYDIDNNWDGWKRVISIDSGKITFHVPDDFDLGDLQEIEPNWDGHSTSEKWEYIKLQCGVRP